MADDTIYCLLTQNGSAGSYWSGLPISDPGGGANYRERYGDATNGYRVYSSYYAWQVDLVNHRDAAKRMVLEIQGKWDDTVDPGSDNASYLTGYYSITITSMVNGQRDHDSFHGGVINGGWRLLYTANRMAIVPYQQRITVDGIEIYQNRTSPGVVPVSLGSMFPSQTIKNCILRGYSGAIDISCAVATIVNNIFHDCVGYGILVNSSARGVDVAFNIAVGCGTGFDSSATFFASGSGRILNNISIGNTVNWSTETSSLNNNILAKNNCGLSSDTIWDTASSAIALTTTDFYNYGAGDFRPALSSSPQVDVEAAQPDLDIADIIGNARPNYNMQDPDLVDCGPFEFDHGNGLAPQQVTLSISGMAEGSVLAIYKTSDGTTIVSPVTIGASGSHSITYSYTGDTQITVVVRKSTSGTKYLPYSAPGLITSAGFTLIVNQVIDGVLNG